MAGEKAAIIPAFTSPLAKPCEVNGKREKDFLTEESNFSMQEFMRISIIIPVWNEAERIGPLVTFLRTHGGTFLEEVLVVDAGSQDATVQRATAAGARVLYSPVCSRAAQMNTGAKAARAPILYFIHADTLPPASYVADIQSALSAGYVMGCYRYQFDSPSILLKINAYFNRFPWLWCQGGDKTFFIRQEVFDRLGGYDEYYTIMEEYDFLRRAMKQHPLFTIPKYATVSARKYEHNGWLRVQLANTLVFQLFKCRMAPMRLKRVYKTILR